MFKGRAFWKYLGATLLLAVFQAIFTLAVFPIHTLPLHTPVLTTDHAVHYYQTRQMIDFLSKSGRTWGYDPYFMAGYPTANVNYSDNNGAAFAEIAISRFTSLPLAIKTFILLTVMLLPVLHFYSCINFSLDIRQSFLSALLLIAALDSSLTYQYLVSWGIYSYLLGVGLAIFSFSLLKRYMGSGEKSVLVAYGFVSAWMLTVHPLSFVVLAVLTIIYALFNSSEISRKPALHIAAVSSIAVIINLYWIIPLLRFSKYYLDRNVFLQAPGIPGIVYQFSAKEQFFVNLVIALALLSLLFLKQYRSSRRFFVFLWAGCLVFFVATHIQMRMTSQMEPARFFIVLIFLSAITVVYPLTLFFNRRMLALNTAMTLVMAYVVLLRWGAPLPYIADPLREGGEKLIELINKITDKSARILIEDSPTAFPIYWDSHFLAALPYATGREYIGGPHSCIKLVHARIYFGDSQIFGRPVDSMPIDEFMKYMDLYNIKWVFVYSRKARAYFDSYREYFIPVASYAMRSSLYDHGQAYTVNRRASFFLAGSGKLEASLDQIRISDASPGKIVIKYYYLDTLRTRPPMAIRAYKFPDDPAGIGFIELDNVRGADEIIIYNS